jgi:hypothetical protein
MTEQQQVLEEPKEAAVTTAPKTTEDLAYEDTWYQVLKQRNEEKTDPE